MTRNLWTRALWGGVIGTVIQDAILLIGRGAGWVKTNMLSSLARLFTSQGVSNTPSGQILGFVVHILAGAILAIIFAPEDALEFLKNLPVRKIPGVGPKTAEALQNHGIRTAGDLRSMPPGYLETHFGKHGARLVELANGQDDTPVVQTYEAKSVSEETTFETDEADRQVLHVVLARLTQDVGFRLRNHGLKARTIGIKVRYSDFSTLTRAKSLPYHVNSDAEIYGCVKELFDKLTLPRPIRLLGVSASNLSTQDLSQPLLLSQDDKSWDEVFKVADSLRKKYGKGVVNLGATLRK